MAPIDICELVNIYINFKFSTTVKKEDIGLYRDEGLIILRNCTKRTADIKRK